MTRPNDQLRPINISAFETAAPGSVIIECGATRVLCTATVASEIPGWLSNQNPPRGWVTAEYNMIPGSTQDRKRRGSDGRGSEIQRLIARVLRQAVDLEKMPGLLVTCDCEVLKADGGTRTASISGAYVALAQALAFARESGRLNQDPLRGQVGAISVGVVEGDVYLDLDYALDSRADVDLNVAMNDAGQLIEIQGTGEKGDFSRAQLNAMLDLAEAGMETIFEEQRRALASKASV